MFDLNKGPNFNSRGVSESDEYNNMLLQRQLFSHDRSGELNLSLNTNDRHLSRGFSGWDVGESSSRANVEHDWPSLFDARDSRFKGQFESSNIHRRDHFSGSQEAVGPLNMQSSGPDSNPVPMDIDLNVGYLGEHQDQTSGGPILTLIRSTRPPIQTPDLPRNALPFPFNSRNDSSSSSNHPLERGFGSNETRNLVQDPTNVNLPAQSHQRSSEFPSWNVFPSSEVGSGGQRGHFSLFPSCTPAPEENMIPSGVSNQGHNCQPFFRSASWVEVPFTSDIEGRHRLVSEMCQILNAMRRGENLQLEDSTIFDPFINGVAELHDRHRDMRLDVDNMSYEELLALEERIGDVNTGLREEEMLKSLKQRKHISFMIVSTPDLEPCSICRDEYDTGDDIATLDCGHDFHTHCIKQWLSNKNLCPICKKAGLSTPSSS